jgi:hypothetical protein
MYYTIILEDCQMVLASKINTTMRAKEFIIKEDEYDQFDQSKDPNLLKVNADTYYRTSKADQIFWKPEDFKLWEARAAKLLVRCQRIYARLQTVMPEEDKSALNGVKILVPLTGDSRWAAANYIDKTITVDLGCFWDLSDDCLAYTIGHEIGHMVWAHGPKKNWDREKRLGLDKSRVPAPENRRRENDADVYGALLAYQLGYDRRKAWDNFTVAYQREPFDPEYPEYPSVGQRKANVDKAIAQKKKEKDAAQQAAQPTPEPSTAPQAPTTPSPEKIEKDAWLQHIMNGMQKFEVALSQDPNMNLA